MTGDIVTPVDVERKLRDLDRALWRAYKALEEAEREFHDAKASHEIDFARAFLDADGSMDMRRYTATTVTEPQRLRLAASEAVVRAVRAKINLLQTSVDIARSVGTSVRAAIDMTT